MKTVLITSNSLRHRYLADQLAGGTQLELIISEEKTAEIEDLSSYSEKDALLLKTHFHSRRESENEFFGSFQDFPGNIPLVKLPHGQVNTPEVSELISEKAPDFIVLFGSSIIKNSILDTYPDRVINLHLGLSPYYRGSGTNLFPFFYNEPEGIGATVHLATSKVDEGGILAQLRPEIRKDDDLHSIGNRVIAQAGSRLPEILHAYLEHKISPTLPSNEGRICRIRDFKPAVLRTIHSNFSLGMLEEYLAEKLERDSRKPIIPWPAVTM